ncbi:hypothetical protein WK07_04315 [Burkholderia multivorans]|nr:hypothetical protein WK07_04315 [Burkholderia multivorans]
MIRFCPECGLLGDIPPGYEACCPDWSQARIVPKRFAELCAETFRLCVRQPFPESVAAPADERAAVKRTAFPEGCRSQECEDCKWAQREGVSLCEGCEELANRAAASPTSDDRKYTQADMERYGLAVADAREKRITTDAPADDRAAQVSDYLNAPGMWAQVYCCAVFVRGCPSDVARSAADAAVKEFGDAACKTVADLTHTLDEVLRVN